ncbi:uncharacterized protein DS421_9g268910 [Arachis hypogaea]|nr:uncharacterized protein DS421_9g268910 [Arachis hypogaea]
MAHRRRKQTLPSTRAHCPPGEQHNESSLEKQHCPAHNKSGAQFDAKDQREQKLCPALLKSNIGLHPRKIQRKLLHNASYGFRTQGQRGKE